MDQALHNSQSRIGCSSLTFRELPLSEVVGKIQSRRFQALDIAAIPCYCSHFDPFLWTAREQEQFGASLETRGLRVSTLNVDASGLPTRYKGESLEFTQACLATASKWGAYAVTVPPGAPVPDGLWKERATKAAGDFRRLADVAERHGVRLSIEAPHAHSLAADCRQASDLFGLISDSRVGCTFDTSHVQRGSRHSLVEAIPLVGAEVVHVHLRDAFWNRTNVTPGKGDCDYLPFIQALIARGYTGDFNLELECSVADESVVEVELAFAQTYFDCLLAGRPLPLECAMWRSRSRRVLAAVAHIVTQPKAFVASYPRLKRALKPVVTLLRRTVPVRSMRYETGWRNQWDVKETSRVPFVRKREDGSILPGEKVVKVAILGCGNIGSSMHAPGFARLPGVEMVGVCDTDPSAADQTAQRIGCPAFYEVADLVRSARPSLVANCTKEWVHYDTTMYLLQNGVDVFCEKVMAESVASGKAMVECAVKRRRTLAINFNWRFLPGIVKIKQVKESGALGELCMLRFFCHAWVWHHALDLVGFLAGRPVRVSALIRQDSAAQDLRPWRRFADEMLYLPSVYGLVTIETEERLGAAVASSDLWDPQGCLFSLDAVFRRGTVSLSGITEQNSLGRLSCSAAGFDLRRGLIARGESTKFAITFQRSIEAFMAAYVRGQTAPATGEDGLRVMILEKAIQEAAASGRRVDLKEHE